MKGIAHMVGRTARGDTGEIAVDPVHPTVQFEPEPAPPEPAPPPKPVRRAELSPTPIAKPSPAPAASSIAPTILANIPPAEESPDLALRGLWRCSAAGCFVRDWRVRFDFADTENDNARDAGCRSNSSAQPGTERQSDTASRQRRDGRHRATGATCGRRFDGRTYWQR